MSSRSPTSSTCSSQRCARGREGFELEAVRRELEALRVADLICQPDPAEMLVVLPNTKAQDARVVEERLRKAVMEAAFGVAVREGGDKAENLLKRTRGAVDASGLSPVPSYPGAPYPPGSP